MKKYKKMIEGYNFNPDDVINSTDEYNSPKAELLRKVKHFFWDTSNNYSTRKIHILDSVKQEKVIPLIVQKVADLHKSKVRGNFDIARDSEIKWFFRQMRGTVSIFDHDITNPKDHQTAFRAIKGDDRETFIERVNKAEDMYFKFKYGDANAYLESALSLVHEKVKQEFSEFSISEMGDIFKEKEYREYDYDSYDFKEITDIFEKEICKFTNCKYSILFSNPYDCIFLSLKYFGIEEEISIPSRVDSLIIDSIKRSRCSVSFHDKFTGGKWEGIYQLKPTPIWDSTSRFTKNMYIKDTIQVISFQSDKIVPIGKGGAVLTDNIDIYKWMCEYRKLYKKYLEFEDIKRGIVMFLNTPDINQDSGGYYSYEKGRK